MNMNYYNRYPGDYSRDTAHLSLIEHGAYAVLLDTYYATEKPLPADKKALYRICRATNAKERQAVDFVVSQFFKQDGEVMRNPRADEEIEKGRARIRKGEIGAEKRWDTPKELAKKTRSARLSEARRKGTHTDEEWIALVDVCGRKCLKCQIPLSELTGGTVCKDHIVPIYLGGSDGIDNIQPMCRECNTGKGNDTTDLRPFDWRERLAECLANFIKMPGETPALQHQLQHQERLKENHGARKRSSQIPEKFEVTNELRLWGHSFGLTNAFMDSETAKFQDHHCSKGSTFKDWNAAWRTWMRKAREWSKPAPQGNGVRAPDIDGVAKTLGLTPKVGESQQQWEQRVIREKERSARYGGRDDLPTL